MPPIGFCQADITLNIFFAVGPASNIQYFIGSTPITSQITITFLDTAITIQAKIDANPTYISSGTTITVTSYMGSNPSVLTVLIQKGAFSQISDLAIGQFTNGTNDNSDSEPLTCNLRKKKRRFGALGSCPNELLLSVIGNPPLEYQYRNCGTYYNPIYIGIDKNTNNHIYKYIKK